MIEKQNDYSTRQAQVLIDKQKRMLEILEESIELFRGNTEN